MFKRIARWILRDEILWEREGYVNRIDNLHSIIIDCKRNYKKMRSLYLSLRIGNPNDYWKDPYDGSVFIRNTSGSKIPPGSILYNEKAEENGWSQVYGPAEVVVDGDTKA